jgi:hypothetical protein
MAVTRIKNNQITDSTITASKIAGQTLVGSLFATDLTLNSNVNVIGNLTVTGTSSNINAVNTFITDPFVIFNNSYSGSLTNYTIGILVNRNLSNLNNFGSVNTAWVWSEADGAFVGIATTDTGTGIVSINNSGYANIKIGNLNAVSAITANSISTSSLNFVDSAATTFVATNFSTGNAVIAGGYISALANATITTVNAGTITTATLNSTTGNITTIGAGATTTATLNSTTGNITTLGAGATTTATLNSTTGNITTLTATTVNAGTTTTATLNTTTGNITTLTSTTVDAGTATAATLNSTSGNITTLTSTTVNAGTTTSTTLNATTGNITTGNTQNWYAANLNSTSGNITTLTSTTVDAGTATAATLNSTSGNITTLTSTTVNAGTATAATLNSTSGNITTLTSTTVNAGTTTSTTLNATTGNITTLTSTTVNADTATAATLNSTSGNITTLGAGTTTTATLNSTTGNITTLGAGATTTATLNATTGNITDARSTTLVATNFSSGNARITGGFADNFPIGANTKATGAFTTLTATGSTTFTATTQSDNATTGAVVVTGGVGIGANLNVAGNLTVTGNLLVLGNTTTLNVETLNVEDLNITVAANATTAAEANGAGLTVAGANATFTYLNADDSWNLNKKLNATTVGAAVVNVTTANITTLDAGTTTTATLNSTTGNITTLTSTTVNAGTATAAVLNSTSGNIGTLVATNFSSGNARITGGFADNFPIGANTAAPGTFTTANATTVNAGTTTTATLNSTTGNITTIGAGATTTATLNATTGNITTLTATTVNAGTTTTATLNSTTGNITTLGAGTTTTAILNSTTGNITTLGAGTTTTATLNATTGNITTGNAQTWYATNLNSTTGNITDASATTLVATNFSSGNAVITGGSINNTVIGNTTPAAGTFTNLQATANIVAASGVNATNFTTGALVVPGGGGVGITGALQVQGESTFQGNINAGNILLSGNINVSVGAVQSSFGVFYGNAGGIGALYAGTSTYTALPTTVLQMTANVNSYAQVNFQNRNSGTKASTDFVLTADNGDDTDGYINLGINSSTFNDLAYPGYYPDDGYLIMHGLEPSTGNLNIHSHNASSVIKLVVGGFGDANVRATVTNTGFRVNTATASTTSTSGALVVDGGVGISGNLNVGQSAIFNTSKTANYDFIVRGDNDDTLIWARPSATYDSVVIGNSATTGTLVTGAKLIVNSTDSILLPAGTTAQRPGSVGGTDTAGMIRFNSSTEELEYYDGSAWNNTGTTFTIIAADSFDGDDTTTVFTLGAAATTNSCITSINGIVQIPVTAYSVSGTTLTFTSAPATGDKIDVRRLITTSAITMLQSQNGYVAADAQNDSLIISAGPSSLVERLRVHTNGNVNVSGNLVLGANIIAGGTNGTAGQFLSSTGTGLSWVSLSASSISNGTSNVTVASNGGITFGVNSANVITVGSTAVVPNANVAINLGNTTKWFGTFYGVSTQAQYADLAENYQADQAYSAGTVLEFGGPAEVTVAMTNNSTRVAGVVSSNPAHLMNGGLRGSNVVALALIGRVPCNVIGPVNKGDMMVSAGYGYARASAAPIIGSVIGKALENFSGDKGSIEIVVGRV